MNCETFVISTFQNGDKAFALLTISEINIDSPPTPAKQYIELSIKRNTDATPASGESLLKGWRLLMIKGSTMEVVMSLDLGKHYPADTDSYVVVGDRTVPNVNIKFDDEGSEVAFSRTSPLNFDESPFAIVLLGAMDVITSETLSLPGHSGIYHSLSLVNEDLRRTISDLLWDIQVVGRKVATNQCDFFSSLFPSHSYAEDFKYILRDRDRLSSSVNDYSLNYCCPKIESYKPACFKLGHPSPGM